jgi:hypothetical protein
MFGLRDCSLSSSNADHMSSEKSCTSHINLPQDVNVLGLVILELLLKIGYTLTQWGRFHMVCARFYQRHNPNLDVTIITIAIQITSAT